MFVNLLPSRVRTQMELQSQFRFWSRVGAIAVVLAVGLSGLAARQLVQSRERWQSLFNACQSVHELESEYLTQSIQLQTAENEQSALGRILPTDRSLTLLGMLSASVKRVSGGITINRMSMQFTANNAPAANSASRSTEPGSSAKTPITSNSILTLLGSAENDQVVAQFIDELQSFQVFTSVDLKSSSSANLVDDGRQFHLECHF